MIQIRLPRVSGSTDVGFPCVLAQVRSVNRPRALYEATAIPVAAAVEQILENKIASGWHFMGRALRIAPAVNRMAELGMDIHSETRHM